METAYLIYKYLHCKLMPDGLKLGNAKTLSKNPGNGSPVSISISTIYIKGTKTSNSAPPPFRNPRSARHHATIKALSFNPYLCSADRTTNCLSTYLSAGS